MLDIRKRLPFFEFVRTRYEFQVVRRSGLFWPSYYLLTNPDLLAIKMDPLWHFVKYGWRENRNPNPYFNTWYYLDTNPDVRQLDVNPLFHFCLGGWKEFRNPSKDFVIQYYLEKNPEVAPSGINPLYHYLRYGVIERRSLS